MSSTFKSKIEHLDKLRMSYISVSDEILEVHGVLLFLQDANGENLREQDKSSIWTRVWASDYSATVVADLSQEPALQMSNIETKQEFLEAATSGFLAFSRGIVVST